MSGRSNPQAGGLEALVGMRRALLRASVIFGSLAVVVIMAIGGTGGDRAMRSASSDLGVDDMMTGSIGNGERYVVSRSVLQAPGSSPCLYFPDGTRRGNC